VITSLQNPAVKNIVRLSKSNERKEQQLFVIEGARELSLALQSDYQVESVYVCREMFAHSKYTGVLDLLPEKIVFDISPSVFGKIAYRENSDGIVALARQKLNRLSNVHLSDNPFIILLESVENRAIWGLSCALPMLQPLMP